MLPGVTLSMGGRDWVVPPLTIGQLRRLGPQLAAITHGDGDLFNLDTVDALVAIVTAAMQRNYPDLDTDAVADLLDMGNAGSALSAVLTGSGLQREAAGPLAAAATQDGTNSMASSPPASATDLETSTS